MTLSDDSASKEIPSTESLERYDLTGHDLRKWRVHVRVRLINMLSWIQRRIGKNRLPGTSDTIQQKVLKAPGLIVEHLEERAKKGGIENDYRIACTEREYEKLESEKLHQQMVRERIRHERAKAIGQELSNAERKLELLQRFKELTDGKPPLQVLTHNRETVIILGDVPVLESEQRAGEPLDLSELQISPRTRGILQYNSVASISTLLDYSRSELLGLRGIGAKRIEEIESALEQHGLRLRHCGA